jgi:hypothetical protein
VIVLVRGDRSALRDIARGSNDGADTRSSRRFGEGVVIW